MLVVFVDKRKKAYVHLVSMLALCISSTVKGVPCEPNERWEENANDYEEAARVLNVEKIAVSEDLPAAGAIALSSKIIGDRGIRNFDVEESETSFTVEDTSGYGGYEDFLGKVTAPSGASIELQDFAAKEAFSIGSLTKSGMLAASDTATGVGESMANIATEEASKFKILSGFVGDLFDVWVALQTMLNGFIVILEDDLPKGAPDWSHMDGWEISKSILASIPIVGLVWGEIVDTIELGEKNLPTGVAFGAFWLNFLHLLVDFLLLQEEHAEAWFNDVMREFNGSVIARDSLSNVKDHLNPAVIAELQRRAVLLGVPPVDLPCPPGSKVQGEKCIIDYLRTTPAGENMTMSIDDHGPYVERVGGCVPGFTAKDGKCYYNKGYHWQNRTVVIDTALEDNGFPVSISKIQPLCEPGSDYRVRNDKCLVRGIPRRSAHGRNFWVWNNELFSDAVNKQCLPRFNYRKNEDNCALFGLSMEGRQPYLEMDTLYTTPIHHDVSEDLSYLVDETVYRNYTSKYDFQGNIKRTSPDLYNTFQKMIDHGKILYAANYINQVDFQKLSYDIGSLKPLLNLHASTSLQNKKMLYELKVQSSIQSLVENQQFNLNRYGLVDCSGSMYASSSLNALSYSGEIDNLSQLNYCKNINEQGNVLDFKSIPDLHKNIEDYVSRYNGLVDKKRELYENVVGLVKKTVSNKKDDYIKAADDLHKKEKKRSEFLDEADKAIRDYGKSLFDKMVNEKAVCTIDYPLVSPDGHTLPLNNNCNLVINYSYYFHSENKCAIDRREQDFYSKCAGAAGSIPDFYRSLAGQIQRAVNDKRTWDDKTHGCTTQVHFEGDCGVKDTFVYPYVQSFDHIFGTPDQTGEIKATSDYFRKTLNDSNDPYHFDYKSYVNKLVGSDHAKVFPNIDKSYAQNADFRKALGLNYGGKDDNNCVKEGEYLTIYTEDTDVRYGRNGYFVHKSFGPGNIQCDKKNFKGYDPVPASEKVDFKECCLIDNPMNAQIEKMESDLYQVAPKFMTTTDSFLKKYFSGNSFKDVDGVLAKAVNNKSMDYFSYTLVRSLQNYCRIQQVDKHNDNSCYRIVLPVARSFIYTMYDSDDFQLVHQKDESKSSLFKVTTKKKLEDKKKPQIARVIKVNTIDTSNKFTVEIDKKTDSLLLGHPTILYFAPIIEQGYMDYGGWLGGSGKNDDKLFSEKITVNDVDSFIKSISDIKADNLYDRSNAYIKKISTMASDKSLPKEEMERNTKLSSLLSGIFSSALNVAVGYEALKALSDNDRVSADLYSFVRGGNWAVSNSSGSLINESSNADNSILLSLSKGLVGHGKVEFVKMTKPVIKYQDDKKNDKEINITDAVKFFAAIPCLTEDSYGLLDEHADELFSVKLGSDDVHSFSALIDKDGYLQISADGKHIKSFNKTHSIKDLYCQSGDEGAYNYIEFYFGYNSDYGLISDKKSDQFKDVSHKAPYVYKVMLNRHLMTGIVSKEQFESVDLKELTFSLNAYDLSGSNLGIYFPGVTYNYYRVLH